MLKGKAKLVIDMGNSETRVATVSGNDDKGIPKFKISILPNSYAEIPDEEVDSIPDDYKNEKSRVFNLNGGFWCNGEICEKEYSTYASRPTAIAKKYENNISRLTLTNAFMQGVKDLADILHVTEDSLEGIDWDVSICLPPRDLDLGSQPMNDMVREVAEEGLRFVVPEFNSKFTVNRVRILQEGFCAFIGTIIGINGKVNEIKDSGGKTFAYIMEGVTLFFDIGAGTFDVGIIEGNRIIDVTRETFSIGGNNVHQKVRTGLRRQGIELPESKVKEGMITGFVKDGSKTISLIKAIASAKSSVSKTMINMVVEFLESTQYPIRNVQNLLVVGGGAEDSDVEGIEPIGNYLEEYFKEISPNISLVPRPTDVNGEEIPTRLLNLYGAIILSKD